MKLLFDLYCGFIALQKTQYQDKQQEVSNINNYITYYTSHTFKKTTTENANPPYLFMIIYL